MTHTLEIHDLADSGQLQLVYREGEEVRNAPPVEFRNPLDASDHQELEWFFKEYWTHPFDQSRARAEAIENALRNLGRLFFEAVFNSSAEAKGIFTAAQQHGLEEIELAVISQRGEFSGLPWELMNETEAGYPAAGMASVVRNYADGPLPSFDGQLPTDQLNVLLVSPNPDGGSYGTGGNLAADSAEILESLDVQVELDWVNPATWQGLSEFLDARPGRYHLVHLDGVTTAADGSQLLLEDLDGGSRGVGGPELGALLSQAGIPIVLLNGRGGTSGESGSRWPELAAGLAQGGVPLVVSVAHPLGDRAARDTFLRQLHQALVRGSDVAQGVAQARKALMDSPVRLTLAGKQVQWDWVTPQVYQSKAYTPAAIGAEQAADPLASPMIQPQREVQVELQLPAAGGFGLVGRQDESDRLVTMLRETPTVLLSGNTGAGKTELALGMARWFQRIGRGIRPGGVYYTTFEASHPSGMERIVHEIGTSIAGLPFADMSIGQQRRWVTEYLQEHPSLLIWDNVENVAGFPTGTPGLLEPEEQAELNSFLSDITVAGQSWALLVTRRADEEWLSTPHGIERLGGLKGQDLVELAAAILGNAGIESGRLNGEVTGFLEAVEGHPLAMQIGLPLLKDVPASVLTTELAKTIEGLGEGVKEEGRDDFLTAVMEYSWSRMPRRSRTHLPFLALFQRRVMMDILNHITGEPTYKGVMGEELGWGATRTLLRSGLTSGFLEGISPSVFQIHPALPWFYGRKLGQQVRGAGLGQLEREFVRVYADTADYFLESLYENQDSGVTAILAEEGNLNQALGLALEERDWDNSQLLIQPLAQVYRMQKRFAELRRLRRQLLEMVGDTAEEAEGRGAAELWLYLVGTEAGEALDLGELEYAEGLNQALHAYLTQQEDGGTDPRTGAVCQQFGLIAMRRGRLDEAEGWLQQSLAIIEGGEDPASVADDYFALGQVKQYQRYYTEAKEWYQKALDLHQRMPDEEEMVKDYRALGTVSQLKFEYQEAESWYHRARAIVEEQRDEETAVLVFHELGTVCHSQYLFDDAISWYEQALNLSDRLGMEEQMAIEFHHLGLLQQNRGIIYDEAEEWFKAAMTQYETLGNRRAVGDECRQLGVLFHEQKRYDEAATWYHQAREIFEELGDIQRASRTYGQLGMIAEEQENIPGALEWVARTHQLAVDYDLPVGVQVKAHLARLRDKIGQEEFESWWRGFTGEEAPTDLDVDVSGII